MSVTNQLAHAEIVGEAIDGSHSEVLLGVMDLQIWTLTRSSFHRQVVHFHRQVIHFRRQVVHFHRQVPHENLYKIDLDRELTRCTQIDALRIRARNSHTRFHICTNFDMWNQASN